MIYYAVNRMRKFYPVHLLMFMFATPFAFDKYNQFSIEKRLAMVVLYNTFKQSLIPTGDYFLHLTLLNGPCQLYLFRIF